MAASPPVTRPPTATSHLLVWLHRWHLLSLDAPCVAVLWTWFVARSVALRLPLSTLGSMFLAVWMLYAADRILDARQLFSDPLCTEELEARHLFHHQHVTAFLSAILAASVALAILLPRLPLAALRLDVILAALLFGWFLLIHARALPFSSAHRRLPKEIAVGVFFPAAIFIPTVARLPEMRLALLPQALLFAAVCTINCLSIYAWEHPQPHTAAHWTTRFSTSHLRVLMVVVTFAGSAVTLLCALAHAMLWHLSVASSLSAMSLLMLDYGQRRIAPLTLRAAADLVLVVPLVLIALLS